MGARQEETKDTIPWYAALLDVALGDMRRRANMPGRFISSAWRRARAIELVWPNVSGSQFPTLTRWPSGLGEGRVWVPSLYLGLLPFLLAVTAWSVRRRAASRALISSWMVVLGALASTGSYGLGWVLHAVVGWWAGGTLAIGDEFGGVYWLLTVALPGYVSFRYPAKLLVIVALALSQLAAVGWDEMWRAARNALSRMLLSVLVASVVALSLVGACWPVLAAQMRTTPSDPLFGPLEVEGAWRGIAGGCAGSHRGGEPCGGDLARAAIRGCRSDRAGVLLLDHARRAGRSAAALVAYAPVELWEREPRAVAVMKEAMGAPDNDVGDVGRVYRAVRWWPEVWRDSSTARGCKMA